MEVEACDLETAEQIEHSHVSGVEAPYSNRFQLTHCRAFRTQARILVRRIERANLNPRATYERHLSKDMVLLFDNTGGGSSI